jgi:hypothetical protein
MTDKHDGLMEHRLEHFGRFALVKSVNHRLLIIHVVHSALVYFTKKFNACNASLDAFGFIPKGSAVHLLLTLYLVAIYP